MFRCAMHHLQGENCIACSKTICFLQCSCGRDLTKRPSNISCAFGLNTEELFDVLQKYALMVCTAHQILFGRMRWAGHVARMEERRGV